MGSSNDGSGAKLAQTDEPDEPAGRGFFGRLMEAFSPSEPAAGEPQGQTATPVVQVVATHGMSTLRRLRVSSICRQP